MTRWRAGKTVGRQDRGRVRWACETRRCEGGRTVLEKKGEMGPMAQLRYISPISPLYLPCISPVSPLSHLADGPVELLLEGGALLARHLGTEPARVGLGALKHLVGWKPANLARLEQRGTREGFGLEGLWAGPHSCTRSLSAWH